MLPEIAKLTQQASTAQTVHVWKCSLKSICHLSMVSDGLYAVVHGELLCSVVHAGDAGDGRTPIVCNRDDPFFHLPTLLINH